MILVRVLIAAVILYWILEEMEAISVRRAEWKDIIFMSVLMVGEVYILRG